MFQSTYYISSLFIAIFFFSCKTTPNGTGTGIVGNANNYPPANTSQFLYSLLDSSAFSQVIPEYYIERTVDSVDGIWRFLDASIHGQKIRFQSNQGSRKQADVLLLVNGKSIDTLINESNEKVSTEILKNMSFGEVHSLPVHTTMEGDIILVLPCTDQVASGNFRFIRSGILLHITQDKQVFGFFLTSFAPFNDFFFSYSKNEDIKYLRIGIESYPPPSEGGVTYNIDVVEIDLFEHRFTSVLNDNGVQRTAKIMIPSVYTDSTFELVKKNW